RNLNEFYVLDAFESLEEPALFIRGERCSLVNHDSPRQTHFGVEEQLPNRFACPSSIVDGHEWITPSDDRVLYPSQSKLESFAARVVEVAASQEHMSSARSIWVQAIAYSDKGGLVVKAI